ncbi:type VI secretion system protein ImpE [Bryocella elongata]|uniref:Type VI secretion system protein ImpE n=1 Tax=Bryocella elongata TaxID=863522 RepID=A0A1H6ACW8_9BACT|nr:type VI secretion system accessory protein TagJ [Bryocella elongata]SEG46311.1 type VI secretion system protein ImpE [Bryocella elongata]
MTPQDLYRAGELDQAIKALGEELRSAPLDAKRRTFLFELLCFAGEYDRAEKQLAVLESQNPKTQMAYLVYRSALHAERTRQEMFQTGVLPASVAKIAAQGGTWNDEPFESLQDADARIGDHLEVFIAGSYTWIPTSYVRRLEIEAPVALRDLMWARARIEASPEFRLQDLGEILLPVLAPLSWTSSDNSVRLGRTSVWEDQPDGSERLFGQKMLLVDGEEIPILEFRSLVWNSPKGSEDESEANPVGEPEDAAS